MKTLVVANQKGGVGKSATVVHLAFAAKEHGKRTLVIDLDPPANASYTLDAFSSGIVASQLFGAEPVDIPPSADLITLIKADSLLANLDTRPIAEIAENFRANLKRCAGDFDFCVIDTGPSLGVRLAAALIAANFVLSPVEMEAYSIQGIKQMILTVTNLRKVNPSLVFLGMVPSMVDTRNTRHTRHLKELSEAYPSLMINAPIGLRSSIADALASKIPVWNVKKTSARAAAKEYRALGDYVFGKMEILK